MMNLTDVESAFLEKSQQIFWFTQNKKQAKKNPNPFLGPNYRNSSLAAQPKLFCICAFRTGLQIACVLHSNHRHLTFIK